MPRMRKKPQPPDEMDQLHPTSVRLTRRQINFLREEAAKRGYFSFKFPEMGAVSRMIADLVEQFFVFTNGKPKTKRKITVK